MARERLSMRKISEVLRLEQAGCTIRQIARVCGIGRSTVTKYLERAAVAGFAWPLPADISEAEIEHRLFGERTHVPRRGSRPAPDWARVHDELQEHRNVTLRLLWEEYKKAEPGGYQYSRFCDQYRSWACRLDRCMRQEHGKPPVNPYFTFLAYERYFLATSARITSAEEPGEKGWMRKHGRRVEIRRRRSFGGRGYVSIARPGNRCGSTALKRV